MVTNIIDMMGRPGLQRHGSVAGKKEITPRIRCSHTHVIAASGSGKTALLIEQIVNDILDPMQPAVVVVDSQGVLLPLLQRSSLFDPTNPNSHAHRLLIIDPQDDPAPALNMFDRTVLRADRLDKRDKDQLFAETIDLYNYCFRALDSKLTPKQQTAYDYLIRLMFQKAEIYNEPPTLKDLYDLCIEPAQSIDQSSFAPVIRRMSEWDQRFFATQFFHKTHMGETKSQIMQRLFLFLGKPAFSEMFTAKSNKLDMFSALQDGKIVFINTAEATLKEASPLFGRFMIALTLNAAIQRLSIKDQSTWRYAYLHIDEAAEYFDERTQKLFQTARKYRLGVTVAHQQMEGQLDQALKGTITTNTAIKYAAGLTYLNAFQISRDMHCDPYFIMDMAPDEGRRVCKFAYYVKGLMPQAILKEVSWDVLDAYPPMDDAAYELLMTRNRKMLSDGLATTPKTPPREPSPSAQPRKPTVAPSHSEDDPGVAGPTY